MEKCSIKIRASKSQFHFLLVVSIFLTVLCLWLAYQLAIGKSFLRGFLIALFFTVLTTALTIKQKTERLLFSDGYLIQKSFFIYQSVYLPSLVRAERNVTVGKYTDPRLRLEDEAGGTLILSPGDFAMNDLEALVALITPYIFITRVEKNFMDLHFYVEQGIDVPKSSVRHIVRGTFLYILLPCMLLTLALIIWAVLTKRAAFH